MLIPSGGNDNPFGPSGRSLENAVWMIRFLIEGESKKKGGIGHGSDTMEAFKGVGCPSQRDG